MNELNHGFRLEESQENMETSSTVHLYRHEKSGAPLLFLQNKEPNKTFGIGFRTPPEDSTGVAHIVEHCVLSGSDKFRTKEPFMDLVKTSMQTFLNAMTFSDMTIYPVSSKNNKDFYNLTDVYMDAVFHPLMREDPFVFYQEGWHHELLNPEDDIIYKGVVYNEMRGAYSSAESQVQDQIISHLHMGSTYAHDSGGNPFEIPKLSLDQFLAFHKKHYHPSNALLFLHGDVETEEIFPLLDDYLNEFNREDLDIKIEYSNDVSIISDKRFEYNSDKDATAKADSFLSYTVSLGDSVNIEEHLAREILQEILIKSQSSPIKKALFTKELGKDLFGVFSETAGLDFGFVLKGADEKNMHEFIHTLEDTLRIMVEEGIDKDALEAAINKVTLNLKEAGGEYRGIEYFITAMKAFTQGKDPLTLLEYKSALEKITRESKDGYFEHLIEEKILNNPHKLTATHVPNPEFFKLKDEHLKEELRTYKDSLTDVEIKELIEMNEELIKFQSSVDGKEEKDTIPKLELSDVNRNLPDFKREIEKVDEAFIIGVPYHTSGITYLHVSFDLGHLTDDERIYAAFIAKMLGISSTSKYSYDALNNEILKLSSGLSFNPDAYKGKEDETRVTLYLSLKALDENLKPLLDLTKDVLFDTIFEKKRVKEILQMMRSKFEMGASQAGHMLTANRLKSYFNQVALLDDELKGIGLFDHLNKTLHDWDNTSDEFLQKLEDVYKKLFSKEHLVAALTADETSLKGAKKTFKAFLEELPESQGPRQEIEMYPKKKNEGITAPYNVQYVSKGLNFKELGYDYTGSMAVLSQYLSTEFLHNEIRAKGGAYGAGIRLDRSGDVTTYSYRDPNLKNTINTYDKLSEYLSNLSLEQEDLESVIIGTASKFDPLLSASSVGPYLLTTFLTGITREKLEKNLEEALETKVDTLKSFSSLFKHLEELNYLCVLGNKEKIEEEKDLFMNLRPLTKES